MLRDHNSSLAREEDFAILQAMSDAADAEKQAELEQVRAEQARRQQLNEALRSMAHPLHPATSGPGYQPAPAPAAVPSCSSDYECGVGFVCAKDSLSFQGVCARAVNQYGVPQPRLPNPGSIGPGTGNCQFDTDCTVGFRCLKSSGGLYGNCMK